MADGGGTSVCHRTKCGGRGGKLKATEQHYMPDIEGQAGKGSGLKR